MRCLGPGLAVMTLRDSPVMPVLIISKSGQGARGAVWTVVEPDGNETTCHEDWLCALEDYSTEVIMADGGFV